MKSKVKVFINNKTKVNVLQKATKDIDLKKQKDGIIPNVIHSLDSSHISKLINDSAVHIPSPVLTVHDCFGTHPNYIDVLFFRLKEEFVSIYLDNEFLKIFHKRLIQYIKDNNYEIIKEDDSQYVIFYNESNLSEKMEIPKPPKKKDLDIKMVVDSKYMFK